MSQARLVIVHPEPSGVALLTSMLRSLALEIDAVGDDRAALRRVERGGIDLLVVGVDPGDPEAWELLTYMRRQHRRVPVILLFLSPHPGRAREAVRRGAATVLKYPVPATELRAAVAHALGTRGAACAAAPTTPPAVPGPAPAGGPAPPPRVDQLARELGIIGRNPGLRQALELAATIAPTRAPVLIVGEPGTGKSLLARSLHHLGARDDRSFVLWDGATPADPLAPDPTRPDAVAAPGTAADWDGTLAQARGGTLFLDEVAALTDAHQLHLLRALQDREYEAIGPGPGPAPYGAVRFLMSTSEDLPSLVGRGRFRQDLYHRISVLCLKLPPLRHRGADIELLAEYFRTRAAAESGKDVIGFTRDALELLTRHDWPGNVRELEGVIRRGVLLCRGTRITAGHLAPGPGFPGTSRAGAGAPRPRPTQGIRPLKEALEEPERRILVQALQALNWNRQETARALDINRTTLYKKMKRYGLIDDEPIGVN